MNNNTYIQSDKKWLNLSDAAQILGVHFTTLRRWADAGDIECLRTPGGRRRFSAEVIVRFLRQHQQALTSLLPATLETRLIDHTRHDVAGLNPKTEPWMGGLTPEQRGHLRQMGHRLMALLLQYSNRATDSETFLDEAKRITMEYSTICFQAQLPVMQTVRAFQFFQRSILDAVHETDFLGGLSESDSQQLYQRTSYFFDETLSALVGEYFSLAQASASNQSR